METSLQIALYFSILCSTMLFLAFVFFVVKSKTQSYPLPPSPKQWPIIGSLNVLLHNKPVFRWIHKLMEEMGTDIVCIRFFRTHVIIVTSDYLAKEFLKKQDDVFSSRPISMSTEITSGGYLTAVIGPVGDQSKKMRRLLSSEVLSYRRHRWLKNKRDEEADHLVRYVYNKTGLAGDNVNVRIIAQHYCGNVIKKLIFGKRFFGDGGLDGGPGVEDVKYIDALFTILAYLYAFCVSDYLGFLRKRLDLDGHEKIIRKSVEIARKHQDSLIDERVELWAKGHRTENEDLLDIMISLKDGTEPVLSIDEIKTQVLELSLASIDNPSNAVEWAIAEMINQPQTLQKATKELDTIVGRDRLVQESDLPKLNYIKSCAKEMFRLHPMAPFNVPHVSLSDTTVAGYFIPKGSHVLISRTGLGRNPTVWENPHMFNPDRHLKKDGSEVTLTDNELKLLSFSTGRRGCIGILLGTTMTTMLLARLLQGFTWCLPPNETKIDLSEAPHCLSMAKPLVAHAVPRLDCHLYPSER